MSLAAGTRLGPYEVLGPLGAGGMGVVVRARDTRLNRDVALKALPEAFSQDAERLARFEREAQTLASLNHPHIAQIHGVEEATTDGGTRLRALVMELVEGEDLSSRIARGPVPVDEALPLARQIAEALEAAHEQGVIHRDLKPANIKVRRDATVKVLDFGLAKAFAPPDAVSTGADAFNVGLSPTFTSPATMAGTLLGTAAYMAPEQAKGKPIDRRADIWAFGVVLYEMLTGRQLFAAETVAETIGLVVTREPDLSALPPGTPPHVRELLRRCLERDPRQRLRDIGEARIALSATGGPMDLPPARTKRGVLIGAGVAAAVVLAAIAGFLASRGTSAREASRAPLFAFDISVPGRQLETGSLAISPDGSHAAFRVRATDGTSEVWVRPMAAPEARPLPGTRDSRGSRPFWSPDGRHLGFFIGHDIWLAALDGTSTRRIASSPLLIRGGAWGRDDVIIFGTEGGPIFRVDAAGTATPEPVTTLDSPMEETHVWPAFLPDGRQFVFLADASSDEGHRIRLASTAHKESRILLSAIRSSPLIDATGALVVSIRNQLIAYPFDFERGTITRVPQLVADAVLPIGDRHEVPAAIGGNGVLLYQRVGAGGDLVRLDLDGTVRETLLGLDRFRNPVLSPDGTRIAFDMLQGEGTGRLIWLHDLQRGVRTLISQRGEVSDGAAWSADGQTLYFIANRDGWKAFSKTATGTGAPALLGAPPGSRDMSLLDVSRDGKHLLVSSLFAEGNWDLYLLPIGGINAAWTPWVATPAIETGGRFSPDSRWIAYVSTASGPAEIYVSAVDDPSHRWQISSNGGIDPVWTPDGGRILYRSPSDDLMSVDVAVSQGQVRPGPPRRLFELRSVGDWSPRNVYDIFPDGRSIVVLRRSPAEDAAIHVRTGVAFGK